MSNLLTDMRNVQRGEAARSNDFTAEVLQRAIDELERLTVEIRQKDALLQGLRHALSQETKKDDFLARLRQRWIDQGAPQSAIQEIDDLLTDYEDPERFGQFFASDGENLLAKVSSPVSVMGGELWVEPPSVSDKPGSPEGQCSNRSDVPQAGEFGSGDSGGPTDADKHCTCMGCIYVTAGTNICDRCGLSVATRET